jgi:TonB family protein
MTHFGPTLRRRKRQDRPGLRTALAVVVSLVVNWILVTRIDPSSLGLGPVKEVRPVDISSLSSSAWEANRAINDPRAAPLPPASARAPVPPPPPEEQRKSPGQVVETASSNARPPKDTKYVSDRDNSVDRETRSRFRGPGAPAAPAGPAGQGAAASKAQGGQDGKSDQFVEGRVGNQAGEDRRLAMNRAKTTDRPPPTPGGEIPTLPWDPKETPEQNRSATGAGGGGDGGQRRPGQFDPRLALSPTTLARLAGGGSPDKLDNVDDGDGTFLNTREWKYATYFNRIKQAVSSTWNPQRALDQRDPDRSVFGNRDRYTLLTVTLDNTGNLKDVVVKKTSGMEFLDKTTVEAFRKAQPFANPPPGIVEPNGEIRFTFGFYLEVGHGFQIFRGGP